MATYEYECKADGSTQTIQRGMTATEITPYCDKCNNQMKRIYNPTPVKFTGTGWGGDK